MLEQIAKFIDFDPNRQSMDQIITEFNHKYMGSWVYLNKEIVCIQELAYHHGKEELQLYVRTPNGDDDVLTKFESIENYLPKTGLYQNKNCLFYLKRLPQKQWVRSLAFGKNYELTYLENEGAVPSKINTLLDKTTIYKHETAISNKGNVYLHWKKIGVLTPKMEIKLNKPTFKTEMEELWQQYPIILAAVNPKKRMEENLQVPF